MSIERKDVRAKLDPEVHEALSRICERDGVDLGVYVEDLIEKTVMDELHKYMLSRSKFEDLGLIGKIRESAGTPGKGRKT